MEIKTVCVLRANLLMDIWRNHQRLLLTMTVCMLLDLKSLVGRTVHDAQLIMGLYQYSMSEVFMHSSCCTVPSVCVLVGGGNRWWV